MNTQVWNRFQTEEYVIGILLIKEQFINIFPLPSTIFMHKPFRLIFDALKEISKKPENLNTQTLINYLEMSGELEEIGGIMEVIGLQLNLPDKNMQAILSDAINMLKSTKGDFIFNPPGIKHEQPRN